MWQSYKIKGLFIRFALIAEFFMYVVLVYAMCHIFFSRNLDKTGSLHCITRIKLTISKLYEVDEINSELLSLIFKTTEW